MVDLAKAGRKPDPARAEPAQRRAETLAGRSVARPRALSAIETQLNARPSVLAQRALARGLNNSELRGGVRQHRPHARSTAAASLDVQLRADNPMERLPTTSPQNAALQLRPIIYEAGGGLDSKTRKSVTSITKQLDNAVDFATSLLSSNPTLAGDTTFARRGYIATWIKSFNKLMETGHVPEFFYARYGYAVETIASARMPRTWQGLKIQTQYATGATRPDFVVWNKNKDIAWLDITSAASEGHILRKQHSGWTTRPFVAEVVYNPPSITSFSNSRKLSKDQKKKLKEIQANEQRAELDLQTGLEELSSLVESALHKAVKKKKDRLNKLEVRQTVWSALQSEVGEISESAAGQILRAIPMLEVDGDSGTGTSWATWAKFKGGGARAGHDKIVEYGARLRAGREDVPDDQDVL